MTTADVLALAPDPSSAKAGQALAGPRDWVARGHDELTLWGECRGSAKEPYRTSVLLTTNAYGCSCPSRKFPCKHVLGLMLAHAAGGVAAGERPAWVEAWLAARKARDDKAQAKAASAGVASESAAATDETAKKRAALRERRVAEGLAELELFLTDTVRLGLAHARSQPPSLWDTRAARLVDAQCPGVARRIRALPSIFASGEGWERRALAALGELALLARAYANLEALDAPLRADVRRHVGWTTTQEEVLARAADVADDAWTVLGSRAVAEERLTVRRTWLAGERTGRTALVLQFAPMGTPPEVVRPGTRFEGRCVYFESAAPLRAVLVEPREAVHAPQPAGFATIDAACDAFAEVLARDPWLERTALLLESVRPVRASGKMLLADAAGAAVEVARDARDPRVLDALSGGAPIALAGEWSEAGFHPLSAWAAGRYVDLQSA